ncbi:hypothetical protein FNF29_07726 [Cafeteria roenbergensis]|uniref:Uncharacterized protein n=2 Tax=Cafeteria roenbergensis TaxID=33653 RepID=A0A5A8CZ91_CAFRO|nr:hypothetical protein FNF29_07726 [Cafeteria roenbergensis]KAA0158245.1 hypothetical protein FNF31_05479 [Cafeteria roenbergensis]|eukprot:KAA0146922.1 hypothetical protein FNF29_07726 [Cafeteria roenbergensis]
MAVIAGALCLLMGQKPTWGNAQNMLRDVAFPELAAQVNPADVDSSSLRKVSNLVRTKDLDKFAAETPRFSDGGATADEAFRATEAVLSRTSSHPEPPAGAPPLEGLSESMLPSPRRVDPVAALGTLQRGLIVVWYNGKAGWFGKRTAKRMVWLHRSPAVDVLAWGKLGAGHREPRSDSSMKVRDIKRVGYGLLTPTLVAHGDKSRAELHVVVQSESGDALEMLMESIEERDEMLAAVGYLIASRR